MKTLFGLALMCVLTMAPALTNHNTQLPGSAEASLCLLDLSNPFRPYVLQVLPGTIGDIWWEDAADQQPPA